MEEFYWNNRKCDGIRDCENGNDEKNCNQKCNENNNNENTTQKPTSKPSTTEKPKPTQPANSGKSSRGKFGSLFKFRLKNLNSY